MASSLDPFLAHTRIAYFTMEIALRPEMHTYSGGLGVLAGDTARSAADLALPMVFVTLASREGYLRQEIGPDGAQIDHLDAWDPAAHAVPLDAAVMPTATIDVTPAAAARPSTAGRSPSNCSASRCACVSQSPATSGARLGRSRRGDRL